MIFFIQRRNVGENEDALPAASPGANNDGSNALVETVTERKLVARPKDGLVREVKDNITLSREVRKHVQETEETQHLGDFPDEVGGYNCVNSFSLLCFLTLSVCVSFFALLILCYVYLLMSLYKFQ